jgi:peptide/nickel transport system substrate-binding protein
MTRRERRGARQWSRREMLALATGAGAGAMIPLDVTKVALAQGLGKTLRVRLGSDISVLDPSQVFQIENQTVCGHVFNGLVKYDQATNKIIPDLAASQSVSADGTVYTFKLRTGISFHKNYGPLTAEDVKFTFDRVLDPKGGSKYTAQLAGLVKVEVPAPDTIVLTLNKPSSGFMHKLTAFNQGWIVSKKAIEELGEKAKLNPIGTGPFVFEKWTAGSEVRLVANKAYFEGAPKFDELQLRIIRDETASAIALEKGEIDIFFALQQPEMIERLSKVAGIKVLARDANHTINLVLNTTVKPLDDVRVRRAMAHALDRKGLIDGFFKGTKSMGHSVLTSSFAEFTDDVPKYNYSPDKAKALLKEAGVPEFKFDLVSVAFSPYDKIVVPMAEDLKAVGIDTTIKVLERGAYTQARNSGNIPSCITGVVGPPDPDSPLVSLYAKKSFPPGLNTARYEGVDDLLAKAAAAKNDAERAAAYKAVVQKAMADVPVIPLYADKLFMAHSDKVEGLVQNSLFTVQTYSTSLKG